MQVKQNAKLLPSQRVPVPKLSADLVPLHWEASALGALQEAGEAYLIGMQNLNTFPVHEQIQFSHH